MEAAIFETKINLNGTLRNIPLGGELTISSRQFGTEVVRNAASALKKKEDREFKVSKGIDNTVVTRLK